MMPLCISKDPVNLESPEGCTYLALQRKDLSSIKEQCLKQENPFSCREHYIKTFWIHKVLSKHKLNFPISVQRKTCLLACGDLGIYYSGIRRDEQAIPLYKMPAPKVMPDLVTGWVII